MDLKDQIRVARIIAPIFCKEHKTATYCSSDPLDKVYTCAGCGSEFQMERYKKP